MWLKWQRRDGCFRSRQSVTPISTLKMVYSRRRSVTGLSVSGTWVEKIKLIVVGFLRINKASKRKKRNIKIQYSYLAHGSSQQHLTCSFMPACLRCRTVVDAKVLLTVCTFLLCEGPPIEGCSAVLAARIYYGFWSLVCAFLVFRRRKAG